MLNRAERGGKKVEREKEQKKGEQGMEEDAAGCWRCKMNHWFNESGDKINFVFGRLKNSFVENRETIGEEFGIFVI
ncbi:hypothetical protein K0M31_005556 [Melipona bicolor]|uniref:Uncharacterized protein n=1 Tax=Melipona bicolor TaxID=60889 RepID=A0AA40FW02_9HYME|nr:hypothetical protein K0M31_005556 [Melipona bicolor]